MSLRRRTRPLLGVLTLVGLLAAGLIVVLPGRTVPGTALPAQPSAAGGSSSATAETGPPETRTPLPPLSNPPDDPTPRTSVGQSSGPAPGPDAPAAPKSEPRYSFGEAVREHLMVPSGRDDDADGEPDLVSVDIVRPLTAEAVRVPVILVSSPYFFRTGRGSESQIKQLDADGLVQDLPLFWDNYFVQRGYAVAAMDNPGTGRSTGCMDVLGPGDIQAARAVVEFLAGSGTAQTLGGSPVVADWSAGRVAMVGKSYDGSVANAVAATGTPGLATIVAQSSISDTYFYARRGGVVRFPQWVGWYAEREQSAEQTTKCAAFMAEMNAQADDATGSYNEFWDQRNVLRDTSKWRASALITHGLTDFNVLADQSTELWTRLQEQRVPSRMWLSQAGHVDPFDIDRARWIEQVHAWFDHWLLGIDNNVMDADPVIVQSAQDLQQWRGESGWPAGEGTAVRYLQSPDVDGGLATEPDTSARPARFIDDVRDDNDDGADGIRLTYLSEPLEKATALSGVPRVRVSIQVAGADRAQLTVKILDVGSADRVDSDNGADGVRTGPGRTCYSDDGTTGCFRDTSLQVARTDIGVVAQGWYDVGHRDSVHEQTPIPPGRTVTLEFDLSPLDLTIPAGHRIGVTIGGSDLWHTGSYREPCRLNPPAAGEPCSVPGVERPAEITVLPGESRISLPLRES